MPATPTQFAVLTRQCEPVSVQNLSPMDETNLGDQRAPGQTRRAKCALPTENGSVPCVLRRPALSCFLCHSFRGMRSMVEWACSRAPRPLQAPEMQTMYQIRHPISAIRTRIRQEFERYRYVSRLPVVDV